MTFLTPCLLWGQEQLCVSVQRHGTSVPQDLGILDHFLQNGLLEPRKSTSNCFPEEAEHIASPGASRRKLPLLLWDMGLPLVPTGEWGFSSCGLGR